MEGRKSAVLQEVEKMEAERVNKKREVVFNVENGRVKFDRKIKNVALSSSAMFKNSDSVNSQNKNKKKSGKDTSLKEDKRTENNNLAGEDQKKKYIFVSMLNKGRTKEEIRNLQQAYTESLAGGGYVAIFNRGEADLKGVKNRSLASLAKSFRLMSQCDALYLCKGWEQAKICPLELEAAKVCNLPIFYESTECNNDKNITLQGAENVNE